jgi:hypothetical protein
MFHRMAGRSNSLETAPIGSSSSVDTVGSDPTGVIENRNAEINHSLWRNVIGPPQGRGAEIIIAKK